MAGKRSSGEGSIFRRKDGRWQASLQAGGVRRTVYGKTRQEVAQKLDALKAQAKGGRLPDAGKMTVGGFMAHWLEQTQARVRPKTFYDYEIIARLHIVPHVGHLRLSRLTPLRIARLYADLSKTQSPRRVAQVHCLLHKALGDARKWGLISENPTDMVDAPKRPQVERKLWTPDQVAAFLRAILDGKGGRYGALFGFLLASGCRLGEALGLRWSDVDWEAGTVRIERQVTELRSKPIECPPKTRAGIRTITLPTWGVTLL
ncbi:MAG: site-specific integrase, partial [Chloroflexi bacterium]|nr:site-specific integrase [Chloroflexota bacterium]